MATVATHSGNIFTEDVSVARQIETADIVYPKWRAGWLIINPQKYTHIPQIRAALSDLDKQTSFLVGSSRDYPVQFSSSQSWE